jgi:hypothetical protein
MPGGSHFLSCAFHPQTRGADEHGSQEQFPFRVTGGHLDGCGYSELAGRGRVITPIGSESSLTDWALATIHKEGESVYPRLNADWCFRDEVDLIPQARPVAQAGVERSNSSSQQQ